MLLAIDVGNTNIVLGVFDGTTLVQSWRLQTLRERTADELGLLVGGLFAYHRLDKSNVHGVVMGSVVPPLTGTTRAMVEQYFGVTALNIEPGVNTGMPIVYDNPSEVGADRIVNGIAAFEQFSRSARPLVIVDFGTATTFDAISAKGEYLGGAICPGVQISRMSDELGGQAVCVATGGLADMIAPETPLIHHVDPDLTLRGLRIVWERNQRHQ